jgi:hypothetical protein
LQVRPRLFAEVGQLVRLSVDRDGLVLGHGGSVSGGLVRLKLTLVTG